MQPILFYDGACNLCHGTVRFVLATERDTALRFASLQSRVAREALGRHGLDAATTNSVVLVDAHGVHLRSEAAWRIARHLRQPWRSGAALRFLPRGFRDGVYDLIARNRTRWFGRRDACDLAAPAQRERFLDADEVVTERSAGNPG